MHPVKFRSRSRKFNHGSTSAGGTSNIAAAAGRARMTQIMKLLELARDVQEQLLFLPSLSRLNEEKTCDRCTGGRLVRAALLVSATHRQRGARPRAGFSPWSNAG